MSTLVKYEGNMAFFRTLRTKHHTKLALNNQRRTQKRKRP
jgi:hypothetical protein